MSCIDLIDSSDDEAETQPERAAAATVARSASIVAVDDDEEGEELADDSEREPEPEPDDEEEEGVVFGQEREVAARSWRVNEYEDDAIENAEEDEEYDYASETFYVRKQREISERRCLVHCPNRAFDDEGHLLEAVVWKLIECDEKNGCRPRTEFYYGYLEEEGEDVFRTKEQILELKRRQKEKEDADRLREEIDEQRRRLEAIDRRVKKVMD